MLFYIFYICPSFPLAAPAPPPSAPRDGAEDSPPPPPPVAPPLSKERLLVENKAKLEDAFNLPRLALEVRADCRGANPDSMLGEGDTFGVVEQE